jgi:TolB-like protein/Flp pilus assembly protein TadD
VRASVAVLPFLNSGGDLGNEHFSDGLADELIVALGKVSGLRVIGRTSAFALKGRQLTARAIGSMLDVATVLDGTVRRSGDRFRITAQLVSAVHDSVLWSHTFERDAGDIFAVQEEIARAIVDVLPVKVGAEVTRLTRGAVDVGTYDLFLKARFLLNTRLSRESLELAVKCLEDVVRRDPSYAPAYAGLSQAHAYRALFSHAAPGEAYAAARTAARQALTLDDSLADGHVALGHILFLHDYDWEAAEHELRRAIELEPASGSARFILAVCLQDQGRFDEALAQLDVARAIDPLAPFVSAIMGRVFVNARRPDDAIRILRGALDLVPDLDVLHQQLGHAYLQRGMRDDAVAALRQAAALSGERDSAQLAYVLAVVGERDEAEAIVRGMIESGQAGRQAFHVAMAHAGLGDADETFRWLEHGFVQRGSFMDGVKVTPAFEAFHADPRWNDLLGRMGLLV